MARPERELDPDDGPVEELAIALRDLRNACGRPSYRELAARVGYSAATLAEAAGGRRLATLPVVLAYVRACGGEETVWTERWRQASALLAARTGRPDSARETPVPAPYRGLAGYRTQDADRFFGRQRALDQLHELLSGRRLVALVGPSGSGKSSLLHAGLLAAATEPTRSFTPGDRPEAALRDAVRGLGDDALLVVDQSEELFTRCPDPVARGRFVDELERFLAGGGGRRVVLGLRADFFGAATQVPGLAELLAGACLPLGPLTEAELREAVTGPARAAGASVERALLQRVVADAVGQPGALPLVSHAMLQTWRHRRGDVLTLADYEATGGVSGAVAQTGEEVYDRLGPTARQACREVLGRLVTVRDGAPDTRRRVPRADLEAAGDPQDVEAVLTATAAARLVVLDEGTVEAAHEALIDAWPRLRGWLDADRDLLHRRQQLADAARAWQADGRDPGALLRGVRLTSWAGHDPRTLTDEERAYLTVSRDAATREEHQRRRRWLVGIGALVTALVVTSALAAVATVQSRAADRERATAVSRQLAQAARDELGVDQAGGLHLARRADGTADTLEAQAALRQAVAEDRLTGAFDLGGSRVTGLATDPTGRHVAVAGSDGVVRLYEPAGADGVRPDPVRIRVSTLSAGRPVFGPGGRLLVCFGIGERMVTVWDGARARVLADYASAVVGVAISRDGRRLAAATATGVVVRDLPDGPPTLVPVPGVVVSAVAWTADGQHLAVGGEDGAVRLVDLAGPAGNAVRLPEGLSGQEDQGYVNDLAVDPTGDRLAAAGQDGTVAVWDLTRPQQPALVMRGGDGATTAVAFSADGRWLATGTGESNVVRVWGTGTDDDPLVLRGHRGTVWGVAFSPDGLRVVSGSSDGSVRFWDPALGGSPAIVHAGEAATRGFASDRSGRLLVTGTEDAAVRVWDAATHTPLTRLTGPHDVVLDVAMSADGRYVAAAGRDAVVWLWDLRRPQAVQALRGHRGPVHNVEFVPDGTVLASAGEDGTVRFWDVARARQTQVRTEQDGPLMGLAFTPDGRRMASGGDGGVIRVEPVAGGAAPRVLTDTPVNKVWSLTFSADGTRLAATGNDGSVHVWDPAGDGPPLELRGHRRLVWSAAFTQDGSRLATAGADGSLRVWDSSTGRQLVEYHGQRSWVEQVAFEADGRHLVTAHRDGTLRFWDCLPCARMDTVRAQAAALDGPPEPTTYARRPLDQRD